MGDQQGSTRLELLQLSVGPLAVNCYVLIVGDAAVVIDPGDEGDRLARELEQRGVRLDAIWLTHAHFDHVGGIAALRAQQEDGAGSVPVHLHPADLPLLRNAVAAAAAWSIPLEAPPTDTVDLRHGEVLSLNGVEARVLHTPGHSPGSVSFHFPGHGFVLSGDALFQGSVGRTDLPLADEGQLLASIRRELLSLPDETTVLPGHGPATTVGAERYANPFL